MTVPGHVDSEDTVWRRRWLDFTSAALLTLDSALVALVTQCLRCLIAQRRNRNYSLFTRLPAMQGATLISSSMHPTLPSGAQCCMGWVLFDEAKRPKPGSRDGPAYFAILTLPGLWLFVKANFCPEVCCVASGFCKLQTGVFWAPLSRIPGLAIMYTCCHERLKTPHLVSNHWKVFLCLI